MKTIRRAGRVVAASIVMTTSLGMVAAGAQAVTVGNLVTNGSFEAPAVGSATYQTFSGGSTAITGWTVTGDSVDIVSNGYNGYWTAEDGSQSVDLSGNAAGGVTQTVATTPGTTYVLNWSSGANGDVATGTTHQTTVAAVNGSPIDSVTTTTTQGQINWTAESASFTATGSTTTIGFSDTTPGGDGPSGPTLDNVSLTVAPAPALPETPSTALIGLAAAGALGAGVWVTRRRRRA